MRIHSSPSYIFKSKFFAAVFTLIFITSSITAAFAQQVSDSTPTLFKTDIFSGLSPHICALNETWTYPDQKETFNEEERLVILLQEVHQNNQSQTNIIATLEYFQKVFKQLGITRPINIALEGHEPGEIIPVLFRAFPQAEITRKISNSFMRDGKIDGAEFYAINSNKRARLFGIDNPVTYQKNISSYHQFRKNQNFCLTDLFAAQKELNVLKDKIFSKPLRDLWHSRELLDKDVAKLGIHLALLEQLAKSTGMDLSEFPHMLKHPEKICELNGGHFFDQLNEIEQTLYSSLARSEDEQIVIAADRFIDLLLKLAQLSLSHKENRELVRQFTNIKNIAFWKSIDDLLERQKRPLRLSRRILGLFTQLEPAVQYYLCARQRDLDMAYNIEALTRQSRQNIVFVIAGGFHTQGLTELFREKKIPYITMTPKPDLNEDSSNYWHLLDSTVKPRTNPNSPEVPRALVTAYLSSLRKGQRPAMLDVYLSNLKPFASVPEVREGLSVVESIRAASLGAEHLLEVIKSYAQTLQKGREQNGSQNIIDEELQLLKAAYEKVIGNFPLVKGSINRNHAFSFLFNDQNFIAVLQEWRSNQWFPEIDKKIFEPIPLLGVPDSVAVNGGNFKLVIGTPAAHPELENKTVANRPEEYRAPPSQPAFEPMTGSKDPNVIIAQRLASLISEITGKPKFINVQYLAGGGMGKVFRAIDENGKPVAIKVLADSALDSEGLERFKRESEAMAQFNDPRLIKVYSTGKIETGFGGFYPFFAMELIEGGNDLDRLRKAAPGARILWDLAVPLIAQSAQALHLMHKRGFLHRDIKPANIMLRPWWASGDIDGISPVTVNFEKLKGQFIAAVADFGLARLPGKETLTQSGVILGTPVFMSPEQAGGQKKLGPEADIYSLGASLYQILTGQLLISGENTITLIATLVHEKKFNDHIEKSLELLDQIGLPPAIAEQLKRIIKKSVEYKAENRYSSAKLFAEELIELFGNKNIVKRNTVISGRRSAIFRTIPPRKRKPKYLFALLSTIPVIGGITFWFTRTNESKAVDKNKTATSIPAIPEPEQLYRKQTSPTSPVSTQNTEPPKPYGGLYGSTPQEKIGDGLRLLNNFMNQGGNDWSYPFDALKELVCLKEHFDPAQLKSLKSFESFCLNKLFADQEASGTLIQDLARNLDQIYQSQKDKAALQRTLGHYYEFPGPGYSLESAKESFMNAASHYEKSFLETKDINDLFLKGISETKAGRFEKANQTYEQMISLAGYDNSSSAVILKAKNLMNLGKTKEAREIFGKYDANTKTFVLEPAKAGPFTANSLIRLNLQNVVLNSYMVDIASRIAEINNLSREPQSEETKIKIGQLSREIRDSEKIVRIFFQPIEREIISTIENSRESAPHQEAQIFHISLIALFQYALFEEILASDPTRQEQRESFFNAANARYRLIVNSTIPRVTVQLAKPFVMASRFVLETDNGMYSLSAFRPRDLKELMNAGEIGLSLIIKQRRLLLAGAAKPALSEADFSEIEKWVLREEPNVSLVRLWRGEMIGKSLGTTKKVFPEGRHEHNSSPIIMNYSKSVLSQLTGPERKFHDPREKNASNALIMLVSSQKELRSIARPFGGTKRLWDEHRIGLLEWKTSLSHTKRLSLTKNLIGRIMARYINSIDKQGGIKKLEPDQIGFLGETFNEDWGSGILRIKYDEKRFADDINYRTACLSAAFYALYHKSEWKDLFNFNSNDNTYTLTARILNKLLRSWNNIRSSLISA
ncbi:MAG: protein kinase [Candidatus Omnitrophica bacterium]|nr:protein kinase [Candidatus Omnitrophota bacterium]